MERTHTLSVVMIVKNESRCLASCLESVRGIADEIVVGDTGSTDGTPEIVMAYGGRLLDVPWEDDFAKARNRVLAEAQGDWLLHLDADEMLDSQSAERIRRIVDDNGAGADAYEVTLANYCDEPRAWRWIACSHDDPMAGRFAGYIETHLLRLFRNRRGFQYREPVHENITESVLENFGLIQRTPITIHHYGYDGNGTNPAKARMYLSIARQKVAVRPGDPKAWHDLAEQALAVGETAEAESACREALRIDPVHLAAGTSLANILCNRGDLTEAAQVLRALLGAGNRLPHVLTALGAIECRQGEVESALSHLAEAVAIKPVSIMALLHQARAQDLADRPSEAFSTLERAGQIAPALTEVQERLSAHTLRREGETFLRGGDATGALKRLVASLRLDPEDPLVHRDIAAALDALGDASRAAASRDRAVKLAPTHPPFRR